MKIGNIPYNIYMDMYQRYILTELTNAILMQMMGEDMDYKGEIQKLIVKIDDEKFLRRFYIMIYEYIKKKSE